MLKAECAKSRRVVATSSVLVGIGAVKAPPRSRRDDLDEPRGALIPTSPQRDVADLKPP